MPVYELRLQPTPDDTDPQGIRRLRAALEGDFAILPLAMRRLPAGTGDGGQTGMSTTAETPAGIAFKRGELLDHHRAELHASGLTDATIEAAGIRSESRPDALAAELGGRGRPRRWHRQSCFRSALPMGGMAIAESSRIGRGFTMGSPSSMKAPKGNRTKSICPLAWSRRSPINKAKSS